MIYIINPHLKFPEALRDALKSIPYDSTVIFLTDEEQKAMNAHSSEWDRLLHESLSSIYERLTTQTEKKSYPATMYELERDKYEGAIVLRRGVFKRHDNRVAWYVTRDAQMGLPSLFPKEPGRKDGLFFMHVLNGADDMSPYLWDTPEEAFEWWEANRERIVAFTSDRLRLRGEVEKAEERDDG